MNLDIQKYKNKLENELTRLEKEIQEISQKENGTTWEAIQTETGEDTADREDVAESIENYASNVSITSDLEKNIIDIKEALFKIQSNTYGLCEVCQTEIEEDRLDVLPEARTCKEHMK
ncbi:MAG: TraR/DksA C4-type zinc finger protein [bacterium]